MKKKLLVSETEVKKALGIESFRNLSRQKIMDFVSLIPYMDKDVATAIVNQFPAYTKMAGEMVATMKEIANFALEKNNTSQTQVAEMYQQILNSLAERLNNEDLSFEEKNTITLQMIEIANQMAVKDSENKQFIKEVLKGIIQGVFSLALLGAAACLYLNLRPRST